MEWAVRLSSAAVAGFPPPAAAAPSALPHSGAACLARAVVTHSSLPLAAAGAGAGIRLGLADIARHVTGGRITHETRVQMLWITWRAMFAGPHDTAPQPGVGAPPGLRGGLRSGSGGVGGVGFEGGSSGADGFGGYGQVWGGGGGGSGNCNGVHGVHGWNGGCALPPLPPQPPQQPPPGARFGPSSIGGGFGTSAW